MTMQTDYVSEELLRELSDSFRQNNGIPPELFTRFRIKRGLRMAQAYWLGRAIWVMYMVT